MTFWHPTKYGWPRDKTDKMHSNIQTGIHFYINITYKTILYTCIYTLRCPGRNRLLEIFMPGIIDDTTLLFLVPTICMIRNRCLTLGHSYLYERLPRQILSVWKASTADLICMKGFHARSYLYERFPRPILSVWKASTIDPIVSREYVKTQATSNASSETPRFGAWFF